MPNPGYGQQGGYYVPSGQNVRVMAGTGGQFTEDFFTYSLNVGTILAGAASNQQLTIQADSDFEWVMSTSSGNLHGSSEPWSDAVIVPVTVSILDSGSGRVLMNSALPIGNISGTGKQPFILPVPRRFKSKSTVSLVFTSFSANQWDNIFFNLIGRKIFSLG